MASNVLALQHSMHGTARPKPLACIIMVKLSVLFTSFEIDCAILLFRSMPVQSQLPSYTYKLIIAIGRRALMRTRKDVILVSHTKSTFLHCVSFSSPDFFKHNETKIENYFSWISLAQSGAKKTHPKDQYNENELNAFQAIKRCVSF